MKVISIRGIVLAVLGVIAASGTTRAQRSGTGTLVVANMSDATATIIDVGSRRTLATLPTGQGPHEVAISHDGRWAVVTNYGNREVIGNSLTVIDVEHVTVARTIELGEYQRPHGVAFLPGDDEIVVTSERSQAVLLVDFATGNINGTMPTGQRLSHMLSVAAGGERIYTTNVIDGTITEIDVASRSVQRVIEVAPMVEGIAASPSGDQVWVGSNQEKTVSVVDAASGLVVGVLEDFGFPYRIAWTPDERTAVISDPMRGEIRVVDKATRNERTIEIPADHLSDAPEFAGSASPEGITISTDGSHAYITLQGRNQVAEIDLSTLEIIGYMDTGVWPDGIGYSPITH
ncbi:MAG: hypothetical protein O7D29_05520 [Gemmatimonadetes bacterium]|nr:hypothetical protein [Gemmatimonadota bacterium]